MLSGSQVINIIGGHLDKIIIGGIDPFLLAVYHVGIIIPRTIKDNLKAIFTVQITHWGKESKQVNFNQIEKNGTKVMLIGFCVTGLVAGSAIYIIPLLFGEKYEMATYVAMISSLTIGPRFYSLIVFMYDIYQKDGKFYSKQLVIVKSILIIMILILTASHNIIGALIAFLITDIITFIVAFLYKNRESRDLKLEKSID